MHKPWNDELISAYLDGELTAEEQAQVELALASDASLRQMHDDLRALRHSLQSMPRVKLGDDFTARVVAQAKLAKQAADQPVVSTPTSTSSATIGTLIDSQPTTPQPIVPSPAAVTPPPTVTPAKAGEPLAWKAMVWSIAGIAAALLCVLLLPREFAQFAQRTSESQVPLAKSDTKEGHGPGHSAGVVETSPAPETLAKSLAKEKAAAGDGSADTNQGGFGGGLGGGGLGGAGPTGAGPTGEMRSSGFGDNQGATADSVAPADYARGKADAPSAERPFKMQANAVPREAGKADKSLSPPGRAFSQTDRKQENGSSANKELAAPGVAEEKQAQPDAVAAPLMRAAPAPLSGAERDLRSATPDEAEAMLRKNRERVTANGLAMNDDRLQVVVVDVPVSVLRQRLMDATLARRGIAVIEEQANGQLAAKKGSAEEQTKAAADELANEPATMKATTTAKDAQRGRQQVELTRAAELAAKDAPGDVEVFYLEAPAEAVDEMLADLKQSGYAVRYAQDETSATPASEPVPAAPADLLAPRNTLEEKVADAPAPPLAKPAAPPGVPQADTDSAVGAAPANFGAAKASGSGRVSGGRGAGAAVRGFAENATAVPEDAARLGSAPAPRGRALRLNLPEFRSAKGVDLNRAEEERREDRAKDVAEDKKRSLIRPATGDKAEAAEGQPTEGRPNDDQPLAPEPTAPQPNDPQPRPAFGNAASEKEKLDANVMRRAAAPTSVRVLIVIQADTATK